jgi:hypothetical protein
VGESFLPHLLFALVPILNVWCHATIRGKIREKKGIEVGGRGGGVSGGWRVRSDLKERGIE